MADRLTRALRLRTSVHRYARQVLEDIGHPPLGEDGGAGFRALEVGVDPIRVLVFGEGIAIAYGVRSREESFERPLAAELAGRTGRGAVVENRGVQHSHVRDAVDTLGAAGTHTFHVAVWCPAYLEALELRSLRRWRAQLTAMVDRLRAESDVPLVLTCLPLPMGRHFATVLTRPWASAINRVVHRVAAERPGVVAVDAEPYVARNVGEPVVDAAYFRRTAARIAPAVLQAAGIAERSAVRAG